MAVAPDAASESHTGTTGSTSQASFSWTHTPVGTPKGVLIWVYNLSAITDTAPTAPTYGGVDAPVVSGGRAVIDGAEDGSCKGFFLGAGIPTGAQTVVVNRTNNTNIMYAICITVTALGDTEVYEAGIVLIQDNSGTLAEQNVDDGSPGTSSQRYVGLFSGQDNVPGVGANTTIMGTSIDVGNMIAAAARETTAGQGSRPVGYSDGTNDERAAVHLAIREVVPAGPLYSGTLGDLGFEFGMGALSGSYSVGGGPWEQRRLQIGLGIGI